MILDPLPTTRRTRMALPLLVKATGHLRAVDQATRSLLPCEHLPAFPDFDPLTPGAADEIAQAVERIHYTAEWSTCRCRGQCTDDDVHVLGYHLATALWQRLYHGVQFYTAGLQRDRRGLIPYVTRLGCQAEHYQRLAVAHRAAAALAAEHLDLALAELRRG
jgi:hypothetical protein